MKINEFEAVDHQHFAAGRTHAGVFAKLAGACMGQWAFGFNKNVAARQHQEVVGAVACAEPLGCAVLATECGDAGVEGGADCVLFHRTFLFLMAKRCCAWNTASASAVCAPSPLADGS